MQNGQQLYIWGDAGIDLGGLRQLEKWYRLKIEAVGDKILFYVDGDLIFERKDESNPSGGVLLWAFDSIVEFDNVVITGDDILDSGPSGYAVQPKAKLTTTWGQIRE